MNYIYKQKDIANASSPGAAGAMWWSCIVCHPIFDYKGKTNFSPIAKSIARSLSDGTTKSRESIIIFTDILTSDINSRVRNFSRMSSLQLYVDTLPDAILRNCAQQAGIGVGITDWSWNTFMEIKTDKVSVRCGYNATERVIWEISK